MNSNDNIEGLLAYIEQNADTFEDRYSKIGFIATGINWMRGYLQALLDANEISKDDFNKYLDDLCTISISALNC